MKSFILYINFSLAILFGQSSIVIPVGASITVPTDAYICAGTITVNGTVTYTGSSLCVVPNAHLIASILEASATNDNGFYKIGDEVSVTLTFNRNVVVTGTPQLALETGDIDGIANYTSGNETVTLTFNYIVKEGDTSPDLEYLSTTALSLNGGSIKNMFDKDAEITLPEPGATNSLSANKDLVVDGIIPTSGTMNDGIGGDIQYSNSLSDLSFNWTGFEDANSSGIKRYFVALGTTSGGAEIKHFEDVGNVSNHTFTGLTLGHGSTYYGAVKAEDNAGNVSIVSVTNGVTVDIYEGPPNITTITPGESNLLGLNTKPTISVIFSEPIASLTLDVNSPLMTINYSYELSSANLDISILSSLASRDEVTLTMSNVTDLAGIIVAENLIIYNTATLADFNDDSNVNSADLSEFAAAWNSKAFSKELGPSTGTVPNLILNPDGKYDLEDVMGFTRMWHWSRKNGSSGKILAKLGAELNYEQNGAKISVQWPKGAMAGQIDFLYEPQLVTINEAIRSEASNEVIQLFYEDTLQGVTAFAFANLKDQIQNQKIFGTKVVGKAARPVNLIYQFYDSEGELIGQGTESIMLKAVPEEFTLHQNYPNPFNPVTTINYDLPQQTHVNLMIYDILGREVVKLVSKEIPAGYQSVIWNTRNNFGTPVSAGIYFYQIQTKGFVKTRKMVLLK